MKATWYQFFIGVPQSVLDILKKKIIFSSVNFAFGCQPVSRLRVPSFASLSGLIDCLAFEKSAGSAG
jgi:hypothetical protein